jgi:rfaE bifunctional protein kinase chain/domain|tara:strand:+ start:1971 stop:2945 length:975 start_codon:yes stop_codon:yes gene_type:complete
MLKDRFNEITFEFDKKKILVIGDLMLDTYLWGHSERISPEAPVPIVQVNKVEHNLGGAANVALNLSSLGCEVFLIGTIGSDPEGEILKNLLNQSNIDFTPLVEFDSRPTTVKSRIISHDQQVIRTDRELTHDLSDESNKELQGLVSSIINDVDGIILEDYNKGVLNAGSISKIINLVKDTDKPIYVDPKEKNFDLYKNVRLFKPNLSEFRSLYKENTSLEKDGFNLKKNINADILMITRSADGVSLFVDSDYYDIPTKARSVHDVSGAGDTVIATFTLSDLCGATPKESVLLSNFAAGRVCEEVGVVPISLTMLNEMIEHHNNL